MLNPATTSYIGPSGLLTLAYGSLHINNANALGANNSNFAVNDGTTIDNSSGAIVTFARNYVQTWNGSFTYAGSNALNTGAGAISLGSGVGATRVVTVNGSGTTGVLTVGGIISNGSVGNSLTKAGTGRLVLTNANAYTGTTTISGGVLQVGAGSTTGSLATSSPIVNNASLVFNRSNNVTQGTDFSTGISGSGAITQAGSGTLTMVGTNTYSGGSVLNAGVVSFANGSLGSAGTVAFTGGSLVHAVGNTQDLSGRFGNSSSTINIHTGGNNLTWGSSISNTNTGGLSVQGSGTLTLPVANNYSGNTTLNGMSLVLGNAGVFGSGTISTSTGASFFSASTNLTGVNRIQNPFVLGTNFSTLTSGSNLEFGGSVNLSGVLRQITNSNASSELIFSGALSNDAGLGVRFIATGGITLSGNNTFSGPAEFRGDSPLSVSTIGNSGVAGNLGQGSVIRMGSNQQTGSNLRYTGTGESVNRTLELASTIGSSSIEQAGTGHLHFTGSFATTGTGSKLFTLKGSTAGTGEISGSIADNSVSNITTFVKAGTGTWTLSGANTYSGSSTISAGTLILSGAGSLGSGNVTVAGGANLDISGITGGSYTLSASQTLAGSGTIIAGAKTLVVNGNLAPGSSPGVLTVDGALTLGSTSLTTLEINGTSGGQYDFVSVSGLLTLTDGATLTLNFGSLFAEGSSWNLYDSGSFAGTFGQVALTGAYTGNLTKVGNIWSGDVGGQPFTFDQSTGNLASVPEPSVMALAALGLGAMAWGIRRRKH